MNHYDTPPTISSFEDEREIIQDSFVAKLGHPSETRKARNSGFVFSKWQKGDAHYVLPTIPVSEVCKSYFGSDRFTLKPILSDDAVYWVAEYQSKKAIVGCTR